MSPFVWFVLLGLAIGWLARRFAKGGGYGVLGDLVVGVIGALAGGFLFRSLSGSTGGGVLGSLIIATISAVIFLVVLRQLKRA